MNARRDIKPLCLGLSFLLALFGTNAPHLWAEDQTQPVPLNEVRLLDSPFKQAQERDRQYMLKLNPDRLLAPFRREADLPKKAEPYGNWESSGLDGHTAGHYLSALAFMYASTGDPEMLKRLNYMVSELAECQKANGNGYVGAVPGSRLFWAWISDGHTGDITRKWAPWYNLHKTLAGLRDAWLVCRNEQAKEVLASFADWCGTTVSRLSDDQMQVMLNTEQGGMNEVLADVYAITGDKKYLALAKRFDHQAILAPLEAGHDQLDGLHANTQIPKVIGFQRIATLSGDPVDQPLASAAKFFWEMVTEHRSVVIGGNSTKEHFNPASNFTSMIENREGPESCNSYNMLKLTQALFDSDPQARYFDFAERVLYNHILTTIDEQGFVYFTPMRPEHYRVYSTPGQSFWCCVGTGMENHAKYGGFIYAQRPDALYVNLFIPSELSWREQGITLRQENKFPEEPKTHLSLKLDKPSSFTIYVRHPIWVKKGALKVSVNGSIQPDDSEPSSYVAINRMWKDGDSIDLALPMETSFERLPDGLDDVGFLDGPIVLAAETGTNDMTGLQAGGGRWDHIATGPLVPLDEAPALVCAPDDIAKSIQPVSGKSLTFTMEAAVQPTRDQSLQLVPFYRLADNRYVIYWQHFTPEDYQPKLAQIHAEEAASVELDQATLDRVAPGEQQPEVDHHLQGASSSTGYFQDRHWRDAKGWFSYDLKTVKYSIPDDVIAQAPSDMLTIKFVAKPGSIAGGVFDVRLIKSPR